MGLLDQFFYGGMQEQQGDPQGALLSELLKLQQPQAQAPPLPTGHVMPQAQAQAPPAPNFLDRLSAMSRGYGEGGLVGGIADAVNLGDSRGERAQAQQRNHTLEYLTANKIDPQTAQMAISNPDLMKSLLGSVVSKRYGDKGEEFKEINKRGYGVGRGPDGKLALRLLDGQATAGATSLPGTLEGAPYDDPEKVVNLIKGVRSDFEAAPAYKNFATITPAYRNIGAAFKSGSAAGDMAALYAFVKLLDPTSVVRESEFATAAASGSWGDQVKNAVEKVVSGQRLTPEQRADFLKQANGLYENSRNLYKKHQGNYTGIARRLYLDPANVVTDLEDEEPAAPTAPPAPQQGQRLDMGAVQGRSGPLVAPPVRISSDAEYDKLPPGTPFMGPDGIARRKP
jgi:hypothetical protein